LLPSGTFDASLSDLLLASPCLPAFQDRPTTYTSFYYDISTEEDDDFIGFMTTEVLSSTGALGAFVFPAAVLGLCGLLSWMLLTRKSVTVVHDADEKVMCVKLLGYPFIGFSHMLLDIKRFPERYLELVDSVRHLFPNACPVLDMQMGLGRGRLIVAADANVAREVLMKRPKTFRRAASLSDKLGGLEGARHNVFFSEGDFWGRMRRLTAPSFSHKNVTSMGVAVGEEVDALVARLTAAAGKDRVVQMDEVRGA